MSIRSKGLVFALESETDEIVNDSEIAESVAEVDSDALDQQQDEAQIDELEMAIEDAMEDVETLERINDVMQRSVDEDQGLSLEAAEMAEIAVESIYNRLGISNHKSFVLESFKTNDKLLATRLALEENQNILTRAWEAFKKAIVSLYQSIMEFIAKLFDSLPKLKKLIKEIKAKVTNLKASKINSLYDDPVIVNAFARGDKLEVDNVTDMLMTLFPSINFALKYQEMIIDILNDFKTNKEEFNETKWYNVPKKIQKYFNIDTKIMMNGITPSGILEDLSKQYNLDQGFPPMFMQLLGRKVLAITYDDKKFKIKSQVIDVPIIKPPKSNRAPILDKDEMLEILDMNEDALVQLEKINRKITPRKISMEIMLRVDNILRSLKASSAIFKMQGNVSGYRHTVKLEEMLRKDRNFLYALSNTYGLIHTKVPSNVMQTIRLSLKYIQNSIKQYDTEYDQASNADETNTTDVKLLTSS